jgi:Protein of unknown function (DUF962)
MQSTLSLDNQVFRTYAMVESLPAFLAAGLLFAAAVAGAVADLGLRRGAGGALRGLRDGAAARRAGRIHHLLYALLCGYGFAWVGHFYFEKNRPAAFKHPVYRLIGDWVMFKDILTGKIAF